MAVCIFRSEETYGATLDLFINLGHKQCVVYLLYEYTCMWVPTMYSTVWTHFVVCMLLVMHIYAYTYVHVASTCGYTSIRHSISVYLRMPKYSECSLIYIIVMYTPYDRI